MEVRRCNIPIARIENVRGGASAFNAAITYWRDINMIKRIFLTSLISTKVDAGLFMLRAIGCTALFLKHGLPKLVTFSAMRHVLVQNHDYLNFLGPTGSLLYATFADGICSLLVLLGLATRWAALASFINLFVAWTIVRHMVFWGEGRAMGGELLVTYFAMMATLTLTGAGKYSLDALINRARRRKSDNPFHLKLESSFSDQEEMSRGV
jgi:putative oxidoreductase